MLVKNSAYKSFRKAVKNKYKFRAKYNPVPGESDESLQFYQMRVFDQNSRLKSLTRA